MSVVANKQQNVESLQWIHKSVVRNPVDDLFGDHRIDAVIQSKRRYKSPFQEEWSQKYQTTKRFFTAVELQQEVGSSYLTSIGIRNARGASMNPYLGGGAPKSAAGTPVELMLSQNGFSVTPEEIHNQKDINNFQGIRLGQEAREYLAMAELVSKKMALVLDKMDEERDWQSAVTLTRGYVPSMEKEDEVIVDYRDLYGSQTGEYTVPKSIANREGVSTISLILAIYRVLEREAVRYGQGIRYMLICNHEFLNYLMNDMRLDMYLANQQMNKTINPLYTGNFLSHFLTVPTPDGGGIDIVVENTHYTYIKQKADGKLEEVQTTALLRNKGSTAVTVMAKEVDPIARMVAVVPNQFLMVEGMVHGVEGANIFQRVSTENKAFNSITSVIIERSYLPVYLCPHLSLDIKIASADDVKGFGKVSKLPTRYQKKDG